MDAQQALKEQLQKNALLENKYQKYVGPLKESFARKGKKLDAMALGATLNCLDQMAQQFALAEATQSINVGTFIQHGYDLVTAIYPNLVSNIVAATQPLVYRTGEVWYYDLFYETAKGFVNANQVAIGAKTGLRVDQNYSSEYVDVVGGTGDGSTVTFTALGFPNAPLKTSAGNDWFYATDGVEIFTVDPNNPGLLIGDQGGNGTINATTGAWSITFNTAPLNGVSVLVRGKIDFENTPAGIGKTKISLVSEPISAQKHALTTEYTLDAEFDLNRNFGMDISDELVRGTAALIRAEIDLKTLNEIKIAAQNAAAAAGATWDATIPSGISQREHFETLLTVLRHQSNNIYEATRMVHGNFLITGNNISTILETLPGYTPNPAVTSELQKTGPYVGGTIAGMIHIKCPEYDDDEWVVGNRGASAFNTGYILAPYRGLMVTPPVSDTDNVFAVTRGLYTELGRKVVNFGFYSYGNATNVSF